VVIVNFLLFHPMLYSQVLLKNVSAIPAALKAGDKRKGGGCPSPKKIGMIPRSVGHPNLQCVDQFPPLPATTSGIIGTEQVPIFENLPPLPTQEAKGAKEQKVSQATSKPKIKPPTAEEWKALLMIRAPKKNKKRKKKAVCSSME
jgi:hypothetical protein